MLNQAIKKGDFSQFRTLVAQGCRPDEHTLTGAFEFGHAFFINEVIALGAKPDEHTLTAAFKTGHIGFVNQAISLGAKPDGETLAVATKKDDPTLVRWAKELGAEKVACAPRDADITPKFPANMHPMAQLIVSLGIMQHERNKDLSDEQLQARLTKADDAFSQALDKMCNSFNP